MIGPIDSQKSLAMLHRTHDKLAVTGNRLATGLKINRAEEDSAGLSISNRLRGHIRALSQGFDNAELGLSRLAVASGAMDSADALLGRATEIAVQAASDTMSSDQRAMLDNELNSLLAELDALHGDTTFNGEPVFGPGATGEVLVDEEGEPIEVQGESISATALGLGGVSLADGASARSALTSVADARESLAAARSSYASSAVALRESRDHVANKIESLSAADSRIIDADFARESTDLVRLKILESAGLAAAAQSNAQLESVLALFE